MMSVLDPDTVFMEKVNLDNFHINTRGEYGGLGFSVGLVQMALQQEREGPVREALLHLRAQRPGGGQILQGHAGAGQTLPCPGVVRTVPQGLPEGLGGRVPVAAPGMGGAQRSPAGRVVSRWFGGLAVTAHAGCRHYGYTVKDKRRESSMMKRTVVTGSGLAIALLMMLSIAPAQAQDRLSRIEASLEDSGIEQIPHQRIAERLASPGESQRPLLLFDVRRPDEFEVGHLPDAIWLAPDADPEAFVEEYREALRTHDVVFYCSTGRRSTELAQEVGEVLERQQSALPVPANMKGGIFRWHNDALPLENADGPTTKIHPYNWLWRFSLERGDETAFEP